MLERRADAPAPTVPTGHQPPPTRAEIEASRPFVRELARGRKVVAVGRVAQVALEAPYVRHPSHGGAQAFREGLRRLLA